MSPNSSCVNLPRKMYNKDKLLKEGDMNNLWVRVQPALLGSIVILILGSWSNLSQGTLPGENEFNTTCIACHTLGKGRLIGPDLAGVADRRTQDWLMRFIKSSQTMMTCCSLQKPVGMMTTRNSSAISVNTRLRWVSPCQQKLMLRS